MALRLLASRAGRRAPALPSIRAHATLAHGPPTDALRRARGSCAGCVARRLRSTAAEEAPRLRSTAAEEAPQAPTRQQLLRLSVCVGVPMIGFGFADNAIMILAGDRIDATLGVAFGFSTLFAAGLGNLISDVCGISLGEAIEGACIRAGLEAPELSAAQSALRSTRVTKWLAGATGLSIGCVLGMVPLLFISDRKHVYFSDDDLALYQRQFAPYGVSPEQFFALMQSGTWHTVEAGSMLVRQGEQMDRVLLLHSGCAESWTQMADGSKENVWLYTGKPGETEQAAAAHRGGDGPSQASTPERMEAVAMRLAAEEAARRGQLRGCIIGGTALVEPDVLSKPYPNQVLVTHRTKYVSWKVTELRAAMQEDKSIESAVSRRADPHGSSARPRTAAAHDSATCCGTALDGACMADGDACTHEGSRARRRARRRARARARTRASARARARARPRARARARTRARARARARAHTPHSLCPRSLPPIRCTAPYTSTWSRACGGSDGACGAARATRQLRASPRSAPRPRTSTW